MLSLMFLSCLPFLAMVCCKMEKDTETLIHVILREQASMIKHCMSHVCTRNMYNPHRPGRPEIRRKMVAFSAYPSQDRRIAANTIIVLDKTRTNIGNAYNPTNGIFTVPVDGVYAFHWTLLNAKGRYTGIFIQVNGHNKQKLYGDANRTLPNSNWGTGSTYQQIDIILGDTSMTSHRSQATDCNNVFFNTTKLIDRINEQWKEINIVYLQ